MLTMHEALALSSSSRQMGKERGREGSREGGRDGRKGSMDHTHLENKVKILEEKRNL